MTDNDSILMQLLENKIERGTVDVNDYSVLAQLYLQMGQIYKARTLLKKALKIAENNSSFHDLLAIVNLQLGRNILAEVEIRRAIELSPNNAFLYKRLGYVLHMVGRYKEAYDAFNQSLQLKQDPDVQEELTLLTQRLNDVQLWYYATRKAIELDPLFPTAWLNSARALVGMGRHHEAIKALGKAHDLNPYMMEVNYDLAYVLAICGEYESSIGGFRSVLQEDPTHVEALRGLGQIHEILGNTDEANTLYRRLAQIEGTQPAQL